jgi:hypothetical protein
LKAFFGQGEVIKLLQAFFDFQALSSFCGKFIFQCGKHNLALHHQMYNTFFYLKQRVFMELLFHLACNFLEQD